MQTGPHLRTLSSSQFDPQRVIALPDSRIAGYSGLRPASFTTLPHFSVSAEMIFPKSAGEPKSGVPPRSKSRTFTLGSARAALISLLSLSTIAEGVFLGAPRPYHWVVS